MADISTGSITPLPNTNYFTTSVPPLHDWYINKPVATTTPPHQHNFVPYPALPKEVFSARRIYCSSCGEVRKVD